MNIIVDTREQLPLSFTGHETIRRKLDEGDYNIEELEDKIVIERKSLDDFYGSIIQGHQRFKREILRAKEKGKIFYIFLEGDLETFIRQHNRKTKPVTLCKILLTMVTRYDLRIKQCTRESMSQRIVETIEKEKQTRGI